MNLLVNSNKIALGLLLIFQNQYNVSREGGNMMILILLEPIMLIGTFICVIVILIYLIKSNPNSKKNRYNWLLVEGSNYMQEENYKSVMYM